MLSVYSRVIKSPFGEKKRIDNYNQPPSSKQTEKEHEEKGTPIN
jgi:hypothetical protein